MSYLGYKLLHIFGVLLAFLALGGSTLLAAVGSDHGRGRKLAGMTHGIALILVLITGFGLIASLGTGFPLWVWLKLGVWLLLGGSIALVRRMPERAALFWTLIPLLGGLAAYLVLFKPGS